MLIGLGRLSIPGASIVPAGGGNNAAVVAASYAVFDQSDITSMWTTNTGGAQVAADGDAVGLQFAKPPGGGTVGAFIAAQAELRGNGAVGLVGSATAATYNAGTGVGSASRAGDTSNQSYVVFQSLSTAYLHRIEITNTGSNTLAVRMGGQTATSGLNLTAGSTETVYLGTSNGNITITAAANNQTVNFTVTSFKAVPLLYRSQATGTKRPLYRVNGSLKSLQYDGSDDCLVTPSIDLTGTDAVTACMGVRKLSDAASAVLAETSAVASAGNPGSFNITGPNSAAATNYGYRAGGTTSQGINSGAGVYAAPHSAVLTLLHDISADNLVGRVNGTQVNNTASDQGTGNMGNYALNFGSRNNGASNPFNGHEYGAIIEDSLVDAATLTLFETWANLRTAAF